VTALSARWLATGGAVVLAGVVGVALLLQNGGSACAAPPSTTTSSGKATFYDLAGGTGNCSFPSAPADDLFVALSPSQYASAASCGSYIDVTGPKGKVRVKVIDSCPECPVGHLDLSRTAFKKIADEVQGVVPIKYKAVVNPPTPGALSMRIQEGASRYWFSLLVDNHANRLGSVQVAGPGGSFRTAKRATYNYWIIDGGAGSGPFKIKITDVYGHTATVSQIKLSPNVTQKTSVRLTSGAVTGSAGTPKKAKKPVARKASPSASVSAPASPLPESTPTEVAEAPDAADAQDLALAAGAPAAKSCG
jgi:expansin (peptidoglycan-binding protein)